MTEIKRAIAPQRVRRTDPKDRRQSSDRRSVQVDISHPERRTTSRRQTELQVLIWQNIRLRA